MHTQHPKSEYSRTHATKWPMGHASKPKQKLVTIVSSKVHQRKTDSVTTAKKPGGYYATRLFIAALSAKIGGAAHRY
jgi:hypothetical protein